MFSAQYFSGVVGLKGLYLFVMHVVYRKRICDYHCRISHVRSRLRVFLTLFGVS